MRALQVGLVLSALAGALVSPASAQALRAAGWAVCGDSVPTPTDESIAQDGLRSAILSAPVSGSVACFRQGIVATPFRGQTLRLSGWMRGTVDSPVAGLWMRIEGSDSGWPFDNMEGRPATSSQEWRQYQIVLRVPTDAEAIFFGAMLQGPGTVWVDHFSLEIVPPGTRQTGQMLDVDVPSSWSLALAPENLSFEAIVAP